MTTANPALERLKALVAAKKAQTEQLAQTNTAPAPAAAPAIPATNHASTQSNGATAVAGEIVWNEEQSLAITYATEGKEFCLIGAAGTGKTTTTKQIVKTLAQSNPTRVRQGTRWVRAGLPGIVLVSFTNRAVRNLAKAMRDLPELIPHCLTIHKLLEFAPEYYEEEDERGMLRKKMRFTPQRCALNPITEVSLCIVDESSMVDTLLFAKLKEALPNAKFIFLGDLNQLPPVFGEPILGFKLAELPVVELTRVYRQAMESPIVAFQHNFTLKGFAPSDSDLEKITAAGKGLTFQRIKKNLIDGKRNADDKAYANAQMCEVFGKYFDQQHDAGKYVPGEDVILMPFNKAFGTLEMNKHIAQFVGKKAGATVHEIIAGLETHYYAEGDYVMYEKQEWYISRIEENPQYFGKKQPQIASPNLDRWGALHGGRSLMQEMEAIGASTRLEKMLDAVGSGAMDAEDVERAASHKIHLRNALDPEQIIVLSSAGEINAMLFGYAITIHKSQGSEWRKVFLFMCKQHAVMLTRELIYTGMTRAKEELVIFYDGATALGKKDSSIARAVKKQDIPGKTWREKLPHFQAKWDKYQTDMGGGLFTEKAIAQVDMFTRGAEDADDDAGWLDDI